jgi:hypothetical protein
MPPKSEVHTAQWLRLFIYKFRHSGEKFIWIQARILYETDNAILIESNIKIVLPKSQIYGIRLKNNAFAICVKKSVIQSLTKLVFCKTTI